MIRLRGRTDRQLALLWLAAAASAVALRPLWLALAPILRPCVFRTLTGIPCPTCGTTRAAVAFLDGHLLAAAANNPLATAAGFAFVVGAPVVAAFSLREQPLPPLPTSFPGWVRLAAVGVIGLNWAYLIMTA
jgi:hypothetical protein